jgi:hypothetical protein
MRVVTSRRAAALAIGSHTLGAVAVLAARNRVQQTSRDKEGKSDAYTS